MHTCVVYISVDLTLRAANNYEYIVPPAAGRRLEGYGSSSPVLDAGKTDASWRERVAQGMSEESNLYIDSGTKYSIIEVLHSGLESDGKAETRKVGQHS